MKQKNGKLVLETIEFYIIDLCCLVLAFIASYYLKFGRKDIFALNEWNHIFIIICIVNVIITFLIGTYRGISKRRYYQQFKREVLLLLFQVSIICIIFYAFKIGTIFSREMMFTMYFLYFVSSQFFKYVWKKIIFKEIPFFYRREKVIPENKDVLEIKYVDNRSVILKIISSFLKRFVDIIAGIVGCIFLIPLTIIIFLLNKLHEEDDGPVFFIQERIGKDGKIFKILKFRSMCVDADEKLEVFLEENEEIKKEFMIYRKIKNDPRITKVGNFLRKTSLDEFPQFINILIGDMSLIGPRPYLKKEVNDMGEYYSIIVKYRPGLTGLWQVSGRSDVTFKDRLEMDVEYHKKHSIWFDLKILLKTIKYVIKKEGAM